MSDVVKSKRGQSRLESQHLAIRLRLRITAELASTFAYGRKRLEAHVKKATAHIRDKEERENAAGRILEMEENFGVWFIEEERKAILRVTREISHHIRAANTIWPNYKAEYLRRRLEWDMAMAACNKLQDELQYIAEVLPSDKNKYTNIVLDAERLYNQIKSRRQADNKRFLTNLKD